MNQSHLPAEPSRFLGKVAFSVLDLIFTSNDIKVNARYQRTNICIVIPVFDWIKNYLFSKLMLDSAFPLFGQKCLIENVF